MSTSRKCLKVTLDLHLLAISCPGERLLFRHPLYFKMCLLNQQKKTNPSPAKFPVNIDEKFHFEKTFPNCRYLTELYHELDENHVFFELVHCVDEFGCEVVLGEYETSLREFMFPCDKLKTFAGRGRRSLLLDRTVHHLGIQPKLEFSTTVIIRESFAPVSDYIRDITKPDDPYCNLDLINMEDKMRCPEHSDISRCPRHPYLCNLPPSSQQYSWHSQDVRDEIMRDKGFSVPMRYRQDDKDLDKVSDHLNLILLGRDAERKRPPFVVRKVTKSPRPGPVGRGKCLSRSKSDITISDSVQTFPKRSATYQQGDDDICVTCLYPHSNKECTVCRLYREYVGKQYNPHNMTTPPPPCRHLDKCKFNRPDVKTSDELRQESLRRKLRSGELVSHGDFNKCGSAGSGVRRSEKAARGAGGGGSHSKWRNHDESEMSLERRMQNLYRYLGRSYSRSSSPSKHNHSPG